MSFPLILALTGGVCYFLGGLAYHFLIHRPAVDELNEVIRMMDECDGYYPA